MVEIKAGEMVLSQEHSAGVTLRFPRITRLRIDHGEGEKPPHLCETVNSMKRLYATRKAEASMRSQRQSAEQRRFLTENERNKKVAAKKRLMKPKFGAVKAVSKASAVQVGGDNIEVASECFKGLVFCVLPGSYLVDPGSVATEHAKAHKYFHQMKRVKKKQDVEKFILQHSGECVGETMKTDVADYYIGGKGTDAKVVSILTALDKVVKDIRLADPDQKGGALLKLSKQKREKFGSMANIKVLKWTWVFSAVRHFWDGNKDGGAGGVLPSPSSFDYLVLNEQEQTQLRGVEDK